MQPRGIALRCFPVGEWGRRRSLPSSLLDVDARCFLHSHVHLAGKPVFFASHLAAGVTKFLFVVGLEVQSIFSFSFAGAPHGKGLSAEAPAHLSKQIAVVAASGDVDGPTTECVDSAADASWSSSDFASTMSLIGCPFWNQGAESDFGTCAFIFENVCLTALKSGGDQQEMLSCDALFKYGGFNTSACRLGQAFWRMLVNPQVHEWQEHFRKKTRCEGILPNISEPIPCTRPAGVTCSCPWSLMDEMCEYLTGPSDSIKLYLGPWVSNAIVADNCSIPVVGRYRCQAYRNFHSSYIERRKIWGCGSATD